MSVQDTIVNFLKSKGLNRAAIAGIMGNMMEESGFNTGAINAQDVNGAQDIGLIQWQGGRRAGLQAYAAAHGTNESNINAQLGFMWQELTGPYSGVLARLRSVTDPSTAASIFDADYEVSAGTTRGARVSFANQFYTHGSLAGVSTQSSGETQIAGAGAAGSSATQPVDYKAALGPLAGLLTAVPELNAILKKAQTGGWASDKFIQAVEATPWWRQHNDSARSIISLQVADPAEYSTRIANAQSQVSNLAHQMGVKLSTASLRGLAMHFLIQGWDQQGLQYKVGQFFNPGKNQKLSGNIASSYEQLKELYSSYGVPVSDSTLRYRALQVAEGVQNVEAYKQSAVIAAKSMYPSLGHQLDTGMTVKDIADPYVQTMAHLLEIDPNNLSITDPTIKRALQGSVVTTNGKATATSVPLYDFEKQVRSDPRWAKTQNATDTMSTALLHIGHDFGFGF